MSKLAQVYANVAGVKLPENPSDFPSNYFPVPEKYITIHPGASDKARIYDHYNLVVMLIKPTLDAHGISIVNLGLSNEPHIHGTIDYRGKTTIRQCSYVIENSMLHFGSDSAWSHLAGLKGIPLVALYSVNPSYCAAPYYLGNNILIDAEGVGKKPYFDHPEPKKSINNIKPEEVAKGILKLLNLEDNIEMQTLRVGSDFNIQQIDYIPDSPIQPKVFDGQKIIIRMDVHYDINAMGSCMMFF